MDRDSKPEKEESGPETQVVLCLRRQLQEMARFYQQNCPTAFRMYVRYPLGNQPFGQQPPPPQQFGGYGQQQGYGQQGYGQQGYGQLQMGFGAPQLGLQYVQQHYQHWQQPSQFYGSYGSYLQDNVFSVQAWQAFQMSDQGSLERVFSIEMQKNPENMKRGAIQAEDLVNALNNTPEIRNHFRISWSRKMCSIMIAMLDQSKDGFMQFPEFMELQACLVAWYEVFKQYDADRTGFIDARELIHVIRDCFKYNISKETLETLLKRYSRVVPDRGCIIAFDDFVAVSVRLRAYTDAFRKRDAMIGGGAETGRYTFDYNDFLRCVMCL